MYINSYPCSKADYKSVKVKECTVHPSIPAFDGVLMSFGAVKMSQFGVNSNIATTFHKLTGMTKNKLAIRS